MTDNELMKALVKALVDTMNFGASARNAAQDVFDDFGVKFDWDLYEEALEKAAEQLS